jgi:hypothetical protein
VRSPDAEKAAAVTRDGLMRRSVHLFEVFTYLKCSLIFCVWRFLCLLFVSLLAFIEPPLQLAIGPKPLIRGHWRGVRGGSLILLLRLCERGVGHAESREPGDRECHCGERWSHNAHRYSSNFH